MTEVNKTFLWAKAAKRPCSAKERNNNILIVKYQLIEKT